MARAFLAAMFVVVSISAGLAQTAGQCQQVRALRASLSAQQAAAIAATLSPDIRAAALSCLGSTSARYRSSKKFKKK